MAGVVSAVTGRKSPPVSPLAVPVNAYVDASGSDWRCEAGFRRKDSMCLAD
jgi:hypothetical protein